MYANPREIRIVEDPHLSDPSWEGVGGQQIAMCADIYAQRDMRSESERIISHAARRKAAADLEGFDHSAAARVESAYEVIERHVVHTCSGNTES